MESGEPLRGDLVTRSLGDVGRGGGDGAARVALEQPADDEPGGAGREEGREALDAGVVACGGLALGQGENVRSRWARNATTDSWTARAVPPVSTRR